MHSKYGFNSMKILRENFVDLVKIMGSNFWIVILNEGASF